MLHKPFGIYEKYAKRPMDFFLALVALILALPVLLILAILVRVKLGSPVLFVQERPGRNGRIFKLYKFRSMTFETDAEGKLLPDAKRLPEFGKKLRATSLDELPELLNILKGDMSIVGPRPLSTAYLPYYNEYEKHRHDVRPGLTGLAQVNGRNSASWEDRFKYDVEYANNITFIRDLRIIFKTIAVVLKHSDIGQGSEIPESFHVVRQAQWEKEEENNQ